VADSAFRALYGRRTPGFAEQRDGTGVHIEERSNLDAQAAIDEMAQALLDLDIKFLRPLHVLRVDIEAGAAKTTVDIVHVSISGTNLTVAYPSALPSTRTVWLADQRPGSALVYRLAADGDEATEVAAYDLAGAPVSLATGTHSVAIAVWP
jgi:hypothetical protein